jgi:hypothetical protein
MTKENSSREFDSKISHATSLQLVDSKSQRRHVEKQNYLAQIPHGMTEEDGKWTGWDTGGRTWTSVSAVETFSVKAAVCLGTSQFVYLSRGFLHVSNSDNFITENGMEM